ncbi:MAG TPA: tetratricopeptide repeat protein [Gemmataceae bacterium]|jgi:tetratricopeptide (TPR) repeat protein|nr:tetratricopeptide repeat protein [Gemmataceae bacterium]
MKAEHRKELQTNVLADRLGKAVQGIKEGPSRGTLLLVGGAALIGLLAFVWWYFWSTSQAADSARWAAWDTLSTPAALESFAQNKDNQGTPQGRLARFQIARLNLLGGLRELGSARAAATDNLRKAARAYEELANESSDSPLLHQEALLGAGKANESLGDVDKAKGFYKQLADRHPDTAFGKDAKAQLERLEKDGKDLQGLANEFKAAGGS